MYRNGRITFFAAGAASVLAAMFLIPGGEPKMAVADVPSITSLSSQETIATIDAMLGASELPAAPLPERPRPIVSATEPDPDNFQTAALTTPEPASPQAAELPSLDASLRADAIGPSAVNLRAGPSTSTSTITVLRPGQAVHVGASDGGWVEITLDDGTSGWVYSRYLASVAATLPSEPKPKAAPDEEEMTTAKAVIKGDTTGTLEGRTARIQTSLAARTIPSKSARTVFRTEPGERVKIVGVRGKWLQIVTADGSSGWIQAG